MDNMKKFGFCLAHIFGILIVSLFLITLLNYFGVVSSVGMNVFKMILLFFSLFIGGFINGKRSEKDGWLEGLKLSGIVILLFFLLSLLFSTYKWGLKTNLFYLIIIGVTTFGSMIGINQKKENASK
ncbi:MAG: TIGR04086 family membrane protein [Bacilli bacterium]|nr:TIGR04086 family membrane protein [Bacilli bacterium]